MSILCSQKEAEKNMCGVILADVIWQMQVERILLGFGGRTVMWSNLNGYQNFVQLLAKPIVKRIVIKAEKAPAEMNE